jgi:hypothetical protein
MSDPLEPNDPKFRDDLASLFGRAPMVPRAVDDAILNRARAHLLTRAAARRRRRLPWVGAAAAVAAACVALLVWINTSVQSRSHGSAALAGDVDHNGRVDIVDAMLLAREIEANQPARRASEDVNHDGVVDRRDVESIAMAAVKLDGGSVVR